MTTTTAPPWTPVQQVAAYELVVDQLKRAIFLGRFLAGAKLPPERELALQLGVSRTTVREAIRVLEGEDLVTTKRGAAGGVTVRPIQQLEQSTLAKLRQDLASFEELLDFRIAVEGAAARLASGRRTQKDVAQLREILDQMEKALPHDSADTENQEVAGFLALDSSFHIGIARVARNAHLQRAVEDARAQLFYPVGRVFAGIADTANHSHSEILDAIESGDAVAAEMAVREHIEATRSELKTMSASLKRRAKA